MKFRTAIPDRAATEPFPKNGEAVSGGKHGAMSSRNLRTLGLCAITACYVAFVVVVMYRMGESTATLYEHPYMVSREAREMKARIYEMRNTFPTMLATPDLAPEKFEEILNRQEKAQNDSMARIKTLYLGDKDDLSALEGALHDFRQSRRRAVQVAAGAGLATFDEVNAYYKREVLPYLDTLDSVLDRFGKSADLRGAAILADMDRTRIFSILVTLLMGGLIIWLIAFTNRLERKKNKEIAYREKLFNLLAENIDEVFSLPAAKKILNTSAPTASASSAWTRTNCTGTTIRYIPCCRPMWAAGCGPFSATEACAARWNGMSRLRRAGGNSKSGSTPFTRTARWSVILRFWPTRPTPSAISGH